MKIISLISIFVISVLSGFSQKQGGMRFEKKFENSYKWGMRNVGSDPSKPNNITSKTAKERLLFGGYNGDVEFYVEPSFTKPYGFRLTKDSLNERYIIEVKDICNKRRVDSLMNKKYPTQGMTFAELEAFSERKKDRIAKNNLKMWDKQETKGMKHYRVCTQTVPLSDELARVLHNKFVTVIDEFKPGGKPRSILDGEWVTFRCVVDDEVRSLRIHCPIREAGDFATTCKQLIKDMESGSFDELNYLELK